MAALLGFTFRRLRASVALVAAVWGLGIAARPAAARPAGHGRPGPAAPAAPALTLGRARFEPIDPAAPLGLTGLGTYRGSFEVSEPAGGTRLAVVNDMGLEDYVAGISEMPATWPVEALRAQAIVARTYALHQLRSPAAPELAAAGAQICSTDACQVYAGLAALQRPGGEGWAQAALDTEGLVLNWRGQPINAKYSSADGGRTVDGGQPYLRAVDDPEDVMSPLHRWQVTLAPGDLGGALGLADPVVGIARAGDTVTITTQPTPGARPGPTGAPPGSTTTTPPPSTTTTSTTVIPATSPALTSSSTTSAPSTTSTTAAPPPNGSPPTAATSPGRTMELAADDFTHALNAALPAPPDRNVLIPSSRFAVSTGPDGHSVVLDGMGFGHGIGMSQYGALGKAIRGMRAPDILAAYFAGLRPEPAPPDELPARVKVLLADSLDSVTITGRFRVVDSSGQSVVTVADGPWTIVAGPHGTVRVLPPAAYAAAFAVDAVGLDAGTLVPGARVAIRYRLKIPALVSVTMSPPAGPSVVLPPVVAEAGVGRSPLPTLEQPGRYHVRVAAVAGAGRVAVAPLAFTVAGGSTAAGFPPGLGGAAGRTDTPVDRGLIGLAILLAVATAWGVVGAMDGIRPGRHSYRRS